MLSTYHKATVIAAGCCLLLSTTAHGFSIRPGHPLDSWFSSITADRTRQHSETDPGQKIPIEWGEDDDDDKPSPGTSRRSMVMKGFLPATSLFAVAMLSNPLVASAGIDVSGLRVEGTTRPPPQLVSPPPPEPSNTNANIIELAGVRYTPAAMMLQMAEQTASMEGMMKASATDVQLQKTRKERVEAGSQGTGPGVVTRENLTQSVGVMVRNSKIATIAPGAAITLQGIPEYLSKKPPNTDMTFDEYLTVAKKYEQARDDLKVAFETMSQEDQQEGRQIVRAIRRRDMERMAEMQQKR